MSTVATPVLTRFASEWKALYRSARISGVVGNKAHQTLGGYHESREDNPPGNYSITRPDDQLGPANAAAAVDMTMSPVDMVTCTKRLAAAYHNTSDPRRKYINAFNGWDGSGDATRFDVYAGKTKTASPDHKWHVHLEWRRKYVNSQTAATAILSILAGESVAAYLKRVGVVAPKMAANAKPSVPPWPGKVFKRDDDMRPDPDLKKWQARMVARGWKSLGVADGRFGPKTESAVRSFQRVCKVKPDGEIGQVTWPLPWTRPMG